MTITVIPEIIDSIHHLRLGTLGETGEVERVSWRPLGCTTSSQGGAFSASRVSDGTMGMACG